MIVITIGIALLTLLVVGVLFVNFSPEFGGKHTETDKARYSRSDHFKDVKFENLEKPNMDMSFKQTMSTLVDFIKGTPDSKQDFDVPVEKVDSLTWEQNDSTTD